jgi:hypothetical protein
MKGMKYIVRLGKGRYNRLKQTTIFLHGFVFLHTTNDDQLMKEMD